MKAYIQIAMRSGHVYQIATEVIAQNRAKTMFEYHPEEFPTIESALEDTRGLFGDDSWNIQDWACNNMNWDELQPHAKMVRYNPPNHYAWSDGEFTYHDAPALLGDFDGQVIMQQPVELVMHTMALSGQLCNVTVLQDSEQKPYGAFVMIFGTDMVVSTYMSALKFTTDILTKPVAADHSTATH